MRWPRAGVALATVALAACAAEHGEAEPEGAAASPAVSLAGEAPAGAEPAPGGDAPSLSPAEVDAALAAEDSLDAHNRRTFEARRRSMASHQECMAQARGLPEGSPTRARIEQACAPRRDGS